MRPALFERIVLARRARSMPGEIPSIALEPETLMKQMTATASSMLKKGVVLLVLTARRLSRWRDLAEAIGRMQAPATP